MKTLLSSILLICTISMLSQNRSPYLNNRVSHEQYNVDDSSKTAESEVLKKWQFKIGLSINNTAANSECSYLISLSSLFNLSFDARPYSFVSFTPAITTKPIFIFNNVSISPKAGVGVILLGPVAGLEAFTAEVGIVLRYTINNDYNILIEYKQISKSSVSEGFETLPPKHLIKNFPIRLISIGIEL